MKRVHVLVASVFLLLGLVSPLLAADPGVTDTEILLGSASVLEGPANFLGTQTNHGFMTYLNYVNEVEGGVNGRKLKLIALNDSYEPLPCVQATQKLINEEQVFILANYVGTPTSVKAQPVWTNAKIPVTGFFTGAETLRTPFNRYNIHIRASYYQEAAAIVDAFVKQLGFKKIAVFYQYDAFGEAVKKGTEIALEKYGMAPVAYGSFERNTLNVEEGLAKIKDSQPEGIVMVGTYSPLAKFVKEARKAGLTKTVIHTVSFVGPEVYAKELGDTTDRVVVTQVMPPYDESTLPAVVQYKELLAKYYPNDKPNFVSLEGFIDAKALVEGLKRSGKNLTREGYIDAIETMKNFDLGGIVVTYGANDHAGQDEVYYTQIINGKFSEIKDWRSFK